MIKISSREYDYSQDINPKDELIKQLSWSGEETGTFKDVLDMLELRQKVLMKYQTTEFYEQKRYENLLKRLQRKILSHFEKAVDTWITTHKWQTESLEKKIQDLEVLKSKFNSSDIRDDKVTNIALPNLAHALSRALLHERNTIDEEVFNTAIKDNARGSVVNTSDYGKLLQLIINQMTSLAKVGTSNVNIKKYIEKAKTSDDIRDQIVAFEQSLNAIHNSGPLIQYLFVDEYNTPIVNASEPFVTFLDYLSNMNDRQLDLNDGDIDRLQQVASADYFVKISFLGKRKLMDYSRNSEWIVIKDFNQPWDLDAISKLKNKIRIRDKNDNIDFHYNGYRNFWWLHAGSGSARPKTAFSYKGFNMGFVAVNESISTAVWIDEWWENKIDTQAFLDAVSEAENNQEEIYITGFKL